MLAILAVAMSAYQSYRTLPFDEIEWNKARADRNDDVLYAMAGDLEKKLNESKITRGEVLQMIGPEDEVVAHFHRYNLGKHRGRFVIVSVSWRLEIVYNSDTNVMRARVMPD